MFDSKIIIYVKFWALEWRPKILECFSPFSPILSPNIRPLLPQTPRNRPPYLGLLDFFSKNLTYICSSALNDQFPRVKCTLISIRTVLKPKKQISAIFAQFWSFFGKIVGAPLFLRWGCISLQRPRSSTQKYKLKRFFFNLVCFFLIFCAHNPKDKFALAITYGRKSSWCVPMDICAILREVVVQC